jgi:hypothetical protein
VLIGLLSALVAMLLNSVANLLQSDAARIATPSRPLVIQPRYLSSFLVDGLGWAFTVVALRFLPVFEVQAVLAGAIAMTALLGRWCYGTVLRQADRLAIGACLVGLAMVAGSGAGQSPGGVSTRVQVYLLVGFGVLVIAQVALWKARAWPLAVLAGLGFGGTAVAVRAVDTSTAPFDLGVLLSQPPTYLVIGFWLIGLISWARALQVGTLASVTAVFMVTEVVAPGAVGIALLGDAVRPGWWFPLLLGTAFAVLGSVVVARAPGQQPSPEPVKVY